MTPFYSTEERQRLVVEEALSWLGTPFSENCAVKGPQGGVSCDRFQLAVHQATGAAPAVEIPSLPVEVVRHWHEHHATSRILDWLHQPEFAGRVKRVDDGEPPMIGDIAVVKLRLSEHHVGLWCGAFVVHVAVNGGVLRTWASDREFMKLVRCYYRIFETDELLHS